MSINITGGAALLANIKRATKDIQNKADKGLGDAAFEVLDESRSQSPFDTGTLMKTSKVTKQNELERKISYNTPYAVRLHEHPEYRFKNGRKGKYLESPIKAMSGKLIKIIKTAISI